MFWSAAKTNPERFRGGPEKASHSDVATADLELAPFKPESHDCGQLGIGLFSLISRTFAAGFIVAQIRAIWHARATGCVVLNWLKPGRRGDGSPEFVACLCDGNDSRCFDGSRLGLVGDQLAQKRNQHDEHDTDRETAEAKLGEEF